MLHKNFGLRIKAVDDTGSFEGLAAVYGNVDLGGDQIQPGAFSRTLAASKAFPLLWQHQADCPIGTVTVTDSPQGLSVKGQLLMDLDQAKRAYLLIKAKVIKGLSIGYDTIVESFVDGVRQLKELRLWEVSVVTFPMNEAATISSVKGMKDVSPELVQHLKAIGECHKQIALHTAEMKLHLKAILGDDDEDDNRDGDVADNPALFEGNPDDQTDDVDEGKALAAELDRLIYEVREFAAR